MIDPDRGCLILAATPIGDAQDASLALCQALVEADVIAAEDTRRLRTLLARLGIETKASIVSYFDGNEQARTPGLIEQMHAGAHVVVATDAGMPSVSDPGYRLVTAAIADGIQVTSVPGPSAVLTALALSGLPVDRFCFEGFAPRKAGERRRYLHDLADETRTMIFFEAPHRLADFLQAAREAFGPDRRAAVCRELTKPHEEVVRATLDQLYAWAAGEVRGEISVVIEGAGQRPIGLDQAGDYVAELQGQGLKMSQAVARVAKTYSVDRKELYSHMLARREENQ